MAGLGLAVKMTFLPLVLSLLVGTAVLAIGRCGRAWRAGGRARAARAGAALASGAALPVAAAVSYLLATMPIIGRLPAVWLLTFQREEVRPPAGAFGAALGSGVSDLFRWNPVLVVAASLVVAAGAATGVAVLARALRRRERGPAGSVTGARDDFDAIAAGAFLFALLLALAYTLASSVVVTPGAELGIRLRNTAPSAIVLPFMVLFVDRVRHEASGDRLGRMTTAVLATLGTACLVVAWTAIARHRQSFVEARQARAREVQARLLAPVQPPRRLAFWTEAADDHFGEASFHFWGNYRYGYDRFDAELLRRYPRVSFLRLRDFARIKERSVELPGRAGEGTEPRRTPSRYGRAGALLWSLSRWLPRAFPKTVSPYMMQRTLMTDEQARFRPSIFAFEESQMRELHGIPLSSYVRTLEERFGPLEVEKTAIAGENWYVLRATEDETVARRGVVGESRSRERGTDSGGREWRFVDRASSRR